MILIGPNNYVNPNNVSRIYKSNDYIVEVTVGGSSIIVDFKENEVFNEKDNTHSYPISVKELIVMLENNSN